MFFTLPVHQPCLALTDASLYATRHFVTTALADVGPLRSENRAAGCARTCVCSTVNHYVYMKKTEITYINQIVIQLLQTLN